ncbi:hypothetical protein [Pseudomonas sp. PS01301]|uniref:hypothetical protein n=1 Tax=Pseudomonas sp. PS01301 TaxID=2991437 RepID=UPI00249CBB85|nr:hypothetical protein [Pseudomonas sp. PS01301]
MNNVTRYKGMTVGALTDCVLLSDFDAVQQLLADAQALLVEARDHIRPTAVLNPTSALAALKQRIDHALLYLPASSPIDRVEGCADAAWLLYDAGFYEQHGVLVMPAEVIIRKAVSYAGYRPEQQVQQP